MRNFGIVGAGLIAEVHAKSINQIEGAQVVGVYNRTFENAEAFARKFDCKAYRSLDDLMADDDIDILTIATASGAHSEATIKAAQAGKHVLCEKPIEISLEKIDDMIAAHQAAGTSLGGIFNFRYDPAVRYIKQAIEQNRLGKLVHAAVHVPWWRNEAYYAGNWHGTWALDGGGALMNQSIHMIDLLQYFMGKVSHVKAFAKAIGHQIEVEDSAVSIVEFENGALGTIMGTTASYPGRNRKFEITGTDGTIEMVEDSIVTWEFRNPKPEDEKIREQFSKKSAGGGVSNPADINYQGHINNIKAFVEAIENKETFEIDGAEARKSVEIIRRIYGDAGLGL